MIGMEEMSGSFLVFNLSSYHFDDIELTYLSRGGKRGYINLSISYRILSDKVGIFRSGFTG